jgi:hypothetical protein
MVSLANASASAFLILFPSVEFLPQ